MLYREPVVLPKRGRKRDESDDEFDKLEDERQRDLEERDAFAERLKEKDKEKTRQVMSKSDKKVCSACFIFFFFIRRSYQRKCVILYCTAVRLNVKHYFNIKLIIFWKPVNLFMLFWSFPD